MKVLLNAESFGFGPSASIAGLFPYLKNLDFITGLDYVGTGHSVDLQKKLDYNNVYTLNGCDNKLNASNYSEEEQFKKLVVGYNAFVTALDFEKATWAEEVGVPTIIYDTLLWYWRKLPPVLYRCYSYIAQDFYGVKERLEAAGITNYSLVAPSIQPALKTTITKSLDLVIINFGGLENPHWDISVTTQYISQVLDTMLPLLSDYNLRIACSKSHLPYLSHYPVANYSYEQMQEYLSQAFFLVATPGLGNIYEAANYQIPSLFLPPANDSQGQQLLVLKNKGLVDNSIDWADVSHPVNYFEPQLKVLDSIKEGITHFNTIQFHELLQKFLLTNGNPNLNQLITEFGTGGSQVLAQQVISDLKGLQCFIKSVA